MLSRNQIKYLQSLKQKKFRQMYNNFVVEGAKMVTEIIQHPQLEVEGIFALDSWIDENANDLVAYQDVLTAINAKELERISALKTPNKVLCVCKIPEYALNFSQINNSLTFFLDGIQNPGNLGSILRIADWFGLPYVFCSKDCVEVYNHKVIQASMGAFLRVKTVYLNLGELLEKLPDLPIFAAVLDGKNIFKANLPPSGVILIGNEGSGIRSAILEKATHKITIPKGKNGQAESLNAAISAGIICGVLAQTQR